MTQSAENRFFEHISKAPHAARGFFETVCEHFRPRNDVSVRFTNTDASDMRLWAHWSDTKGKDRDQIFGTIAWRSREQTVFVRCQLSPEELTMLGVEGGQQPSHPKEPQKSEIWLDEGFWRYRVSDFIRVMETARIKLVQN